eukprot:366570-Chlamydomonas_euryale.AAC.11
MPSRHHHHTLNNTQRRLHPQHTYSRTQAFAPTPRKTRPPPPPVSTGHHTPPNLSIDPIIYPSISDECLMALYMMNEA